MCADCFEDPYNWQNSRACTYDYRIQTGDTSHAYLRVNTTSTLYYIQEITTNGKTPSERQIYFKYGLAICEGCEVFCQTDVQADTISTTQTDEIAYPDEGNTDGGGGEQPIITKACSLNNDLDLIFNGIQCKDHYYYSNGECLECQANCKSCTSFTCMACLDGYSLSDSSCVLCPEGCQKCEQSYDYNDLPIVMCTQCQQTSDYYLIQSLDFKTCESCEYQCARCEYMYYDATGWIDYATRNQYADTTLAYIKRCRQCTSSGLFISPNGIECEQCNIVNCAFCYYVLAKGNTYDYDFTPSTPTEGQKCKQCKSGYTLSADSSSCALPSPSSPCLSASATNCLSCDKKALQLSDYLCSAKDCSTKIKNCLNCYVYSKIFGTVLVGQDTQPFFQCIECNPGYYIDIFSGNCVSCPSNCKSCWQYTQSYNLTSYLPTLNPITDDDYLWFISEPLFDVQCTKCFDGFSLYGNECMGCSGNCYYMETATISACMQGYDNAFCYRCQDTLQSQSLVSDLSECQECAKYCAACRDRGDNDPVVNPYFSPSSDQLVKYSRLCYKLRSDLSAQIITVRNAEIAGGKTNILANIFLDNQLGLPVQCYKQVTDTINDYKCYNKQSIAIQLSCSDHPGVKKLSVFGEQKSNVITITFSEDSYLNYLAYNQNSIKELNIQLTLLGDLCQFKRAATFQFLFLQNVFSLSKVNLNIQSSPDDPTIQQSWETSGMIKFVGVSSVSINNVIIKYILPSGKVSSKLFGLQLTSQDETQFMLSNVEFQKDQYQNQILTIQIDNPVNVTLSGVKFQNLETIDKVMKFNYSLTTLSYQDIKIVNVIIQNSLFNNTNFILFTNRAQQSFLLIQNLQIINGWFYSSSLIKSNNPQSSLYYSVSKVNLMFIYFENSIVFYLTNLQTSKSFQSIDSVQNKYNSSKLFLMNSFSITKCYVFHNVLLNNSILMASIEEIKTNDALRSSINMFTLDRIKIINSKCYSINCLIVAQTPVNPYSIITSVSLTNIQLNNIVISDIEASAVFLTTSAIIQLLNFADVKLNNIIIDNVIGITLFQIQKIQTVSITTLRYDWSKSNKLNSFTNPINNLISTTQECANSKVLGQAFTYILFFIFQFSSTITISDIQIQRQLLIDAPFFHIQSYDVAFSNTTVGSIVEQISFSNLQFLNNSIISNTKGLFSGCIRIESNQLQTISMDTVNFQSTHLQQLISKQTVQLASLFSIVSQKAIIIIKNFQSDYNRAVACQQGLIIISCYSLTISNATFTYTNIVDKNWVPRLEPNQLTTNDDYRSFFDIRSQGTLMEASLSIGNFTQIFVNYTNGVQPGFKFITIGQGSLNMEDVYMANIFGNLELKYSSIGGGLYIDSGFSSLTFLIKNMSMFNSRVRQSGGCIYILSSNKNQNITIQSSSFSRCQALESSFMYVEFFADANSQYVTLDTVQISNNSMNNLLSITPQIQAFEYLYFLQTSSVYTQMNGKLIISDCNFVDIDYQSVMQLHTLALLSINGLTISSSKIYYNPIIQLSLLQSGAQVFIGNLEMNLNEETPQTANNTIDCTSLMIKPFTYTAAQQNCDSMASAQEYLDEISSADEIYEYYDELIETAYNKLTDGDKYVPSNIQTVQYQITTSILEIMDYSNQHLVNCLLSSILYLATQLNLDQFSSLFYLKEVNDNHVVQIKKMSLTQNTCYRCMGGLFQMRSIADANQKRLILIEELFCQYNIAGYYGCATFTNNEAIVQVELLSQIINSSLTTDGRLLQSLDITSLNHTLLVSSYKCNDNSARAGTCLNVNGITTIVMDSQFVSNNASLVGGAIYFVNSGSTDFYQQSNQFINNQAQQGGGIYLVNYQLSNTDKQSVDFQKNIANEGAIDVQEQTMAQTLQLSDTPFSSYVYLNNSGDQNEDGSIDNASVIIRDNVTLNYHKTGNYPQLTNLLILPSGQKIQNYSFFYNVTQEQVPFEWVFRIINLNRFGDPVKNGQPEDTCNIDGRIQNQHKYDDKLEFTNNFTIPSKVNYNSDKGGFDMDDLTVIFDPQFHPDYYLELRFTCNAVEIPIYNPKPPYQIIGYNKNYELIARVRTFPCQVGEAYDAQKCKACQKADLAYSVVPDSIQCKQMNRLTMKTVSPTGIALLKGYWRPNYQNDQVESCLHLANNCNGGWVPGAPSCYTGHLGALCESCDIYQVYSEEKWAPSGAYKCGLCKDSEQLSVVLITAISILTMVSTIMSVKGTYESLQIQIVQEAVAMFRVRLKSDSANLATIVQVLTNYFQIVQIVMTFQLMIPSGVATATSTAGNPTGSMAYSLDCLLIKISDIEVLYFKMIWALIMPLSYLGVIILGYLLICLLKVTKFTSSILYTAVIYIFLYLHPTVVQGFISQASTRTISGLPWVKADVGYRYDSDLHSYWMARFIGPMLGIWVIGLPAFFMFLVWRKRKVLNLKQTKMTLGYFYRQYQPDSYLWEFIKLFQKEFFVIILVYYEEFVIIKGLLIVLVLFIYGWYQVSVSPFGSKTLNNTDRYSTMVCAATLSLGVLMYGAQLRDYYYLEVIILIIMALLNLWFIIMCVLQIFEGYLIKFQDQLDLIREMLIKSNPQLQERRGFVGKLLIHKGKMRERVKILWNLCKQKTLIAVKITKLVDNVSFEEALTYVVANNVREHQLPKLPQKLKGEFEKLHSI